MTGFCTYYNTGKAVSNNSSIFNLILVVFYIFTSALTQTFASIFALVLVSGLLKKYIDKSYKKPSNWP